MKEAIKDSVGRVGKNNVEDVLAVQHLLIQHGLNIGRADGLCGPRTIAGINMFQAAFLHHPDGLVEPTGKTIKRLLMVGFHWHWHMGKFIAPVVTSTHIEQVAPSEVPYAITRLIPKASLGPLNTGLVAAGNTFMLERLGEPRES